MKNLVAAVRIQRNGGFLKVLLLGLAVISGVISCGKDKVPAGGGGAPAPGAKSAKVEPPKEKPPKSAKELELFSQTWELRSDATSFTSPDYAEGRGLRGTSFSVTRILDVTLTESHIHLSLTCYTELDYGDSRGYKPTYSKGSAKIRVDSEKIEILEKVKQYDSMYRQFGSSQWAREYYCHASLIPAVFEYKFVNDSYTGKRKLELSLKSGGDQRKLDFWVPDNAWDIGPLAQSVSLY